MCRSEATKCAKTHIITKCPCRACRAIFGEDRAESEGPGVDSTGASLAIGFRDLPNMGVARYSRRKLCRGWREGRRLGWHVSAGSPSRRRMPAVAEGLR